MGMDAKEFVHAAKERYTRYFFQDHSANMRGNFRYGWIKPAEV